MFSKLLSKIASLSGKHLDFLKKAFSDNGTPSMSRVMTIPHVIIACWAVVYIALKTHGIGLDTLTGLGGFATVHYGVNRISNMFGGQKRDQSGGNADTAAQIVSDKDKPNG